MTPFNLADCFDAIAAVCPDREALAQAGQRRTWSELERRARNLAAWMRLQSATHQAKVAIYTYNHPAYMEGVYAAMERRAADGGPRDGWRLEERLGFEEVVRAYTLEAACASGTDRRLGRLATGMEADIVAWDLYSAIERGDGTAFRAGRAILTVVGGRVVMHR